MLTANTNGSSISYTYDAGGIRQSQTVDSVITHYLVDPNRSYHQVLEEQDDLFLPQVLYTYGDDLINQTNDQGVHTFGYDGLGSTRILTDQTGAVVNSYGYQAFGELDYEYGSVENNYLFTGEQYDNNVGFYYLRARYYNPEIGRFSQMDVFPGMQFEPKSLHKYLYTHADPVNNIDPSGYFSSLVEVGASAAVAGIITAYAVYTYNKFFNAGAANWDDDDWSRPGSDGWLIVVASRLTSSQISQRVRDQINEDDSSQYEYFHGTDITTAVYLLNKGPIYIDTSNCNWDASCGGFYLADNRGDAEHFAVFTQSGVRDGAVVQYTFSAFANQVIRGVSVFEPIPVATNQGQASIKEIQLNLLRVLSA
ncbi:RHS repeat-associated core domain-containing protein [Marinicella sp. S1101]|nr:RHS repeat-associated core domain-containing protein [Marinicella marina]MCX7554685.1 RHS repeat-associated core domain-containing protein [Marinicella marina]MDJ1140750.1 RHS repeat-associated core domain-containing protein [Marinicella marina]